MSAKTTLKSVGLIGWPVEHSASPAMFNAAFEAQGMPWRYTAYPIAPDALGQGLHTLRQQGVCGLNVTVPHKRSVIPYLDGVLPDAKAVGAVNTIIATVQDNRTVWQGTNTDAAGFRSDLIARLDPQPGERALILGAGGAARAAAYVLYRLGLQIYIVSRRPERGLALIRELQASLSDRAKSSNIEATHWRVQMRTLPYNRLRDLHEPVDLIVNCTPVGMWPNVDTSPWPEDIPLPATAAIYDMVYRPATTRLMQQAAAAGLTAVGGLGMLVRQGAAAFELWTGQPAPIDLMFNAAQRVLQP